MDKVAKTLLIAGLLLLLCAPALAVAQIERPVKPSPCTDVAPVIDGQVEEVWERYAHQEDITIDFELVDLQDEIPHPYAVFLLTMNDQDTLYILVAELWTELNATAQQQLFSVFCMGFEDELPAWEWNVQNPAMDSGEGWLCFVGGVGFDIGHVPSSQDWQQLESAAFYIGRIGGEQEGPEDCFDGLWVDFDDMPPDAPALLGVDHAFGVHYNGYLVWVHEVAIDLSQSPLTRSPEDSFRGWFGAFGMAPFGQGDAAQFDSVEDFRALADLIGQPPTEELLMGLWPGGRGMVDPTDPPEQQEDDMLWFVDCCLEHGDFEESCDWCVPCFGEIELAPCEVEPVVERAVEFVPEPTTMLLLGSGLMGLAGYAHLRLRKR